MQQDRREFLGSAARLATQTGVGLALTAGAGTALAARAEPDFARIREEFPWASKQLFMNPSGWHPMRVQTAEAMRRYLEFKVNGPGEGRGEWAGGHKEIAKARFAQLINASPDEISFVQSTLVGENLTRMALGIRGGDWNVVTDELHYEASMYMYTTLKKQGLDVRVVKQKDGAVDVRDVEKVVDKKTRLIACSLVSYLTGYRHDVKKLADLAHSHGGYIYCDVIQSAGAVPIDVKALDIDFCACSGYKWLMGDRGLGYWYIRKELQGKVVRRFQYGDPQFSDFQYHMFPFDPPGARPATWVQGTGAGAMFEMGNVANIVAAGHAESIKFILDLGVDRIQAYVKPMVEKLRTEMPRLGYPCLTPPGTPTAISAFVVEKPDVLAAKLKKRNIDTKIEWHQTRVSVSVYHNMADIDRFLEAVS